MAGAPLPPPTSSAEGRDYLNGWKEIAAFLGKGVRTVQRWEREYALPVHRLGRDGGEIVWASRRELDEWLRTHGPRARESDHREEAEFPAPRAGSPQLDTAPAPVELSTVHRSTGLGLTLLVLLVLAGAIWGGMVYITPKTPPTSWQFAAGRFTVFGADGAELFTRPFPSLASSTYTKEADGAPGGRVVLADLNADGVAEVLFGAASGHFPPEVGLYVFDARGRERFVVQPTRTVTFGSRTYSGPWMPTHVRVIGEGQALSIFVAFIGPLEFPSLLLELDATGQVQSEYWSNGYIESVERASWRGRTAVFVGATNNDTRGASLAVFPDGHAAGSAPAVQEAFRCLDCPQGGPAEFLIFPRRAVALAYPGGEGQATVHQARVEPDGKIHVAVGDVGPMNPIGWFESLVWYTLDASLMPLGAEVTPGAHAAHEAGLKRPFDESDRAALFPIRRWDAASRRFVDLPRPPG